MINKKKRLFKILFFPITLLICLSFFMISSFAESGYIVEVNGDVKSLNIWNEQWRNGFYDTSNGSFIANSDYVCSDGSISLEPSTTYSISIVNNMDFQFYDINGNFLYNISRYIRDGNSYTFTTNSNVYYMTFYITDLYGNTYQNDIMLNFGSTLFEYFPYGYYYANGVYNNVSIYNLFNGGFAELLLTNNQDAGWFAFDWLNFSQDKKSITLNDLPNIRDYLYTNAQSSNDEWIIKLFMPNRVSTYANMRLSYNPKSYNSNFYVGLDSLENNNSVSYFASDNMNVVSLYSNNFEYDTVSIHGFYKYYIDAFELTLNTLDSGLYNQGYTDGYNNGAKNGSNVGYSQGYQVGYNDGMNTDITTNGIKTLFNSILSFPVDMIKSVFNFEFMGVNVASVITFIISIGIVAFVLKKFL